MQGIRVKRTRLPSFTPPHKPAFSQPAPEVLTGMVQNKKATAPEERMAKALEGHVDAFVFSYTVGAPKGAPGFNQLDFVVSKQGMIKEIEVDNLWTHRDKQIKDKVHDAFAISELRKIFGDAVWPNVYRAIDSVDLKDQKTANEWVALNIGT